MSATGLSIILLAMISAGALIAAIRAEAASPSSQAKPFRVAPQTFPRTRSTLRCLPKILAKCPQGQRHICVAFSGGCCVKLACARKGK